MTLRLAPIVLWLAAACVVVAVGVGQATSPRLGPVLLIALVAGVALIAPAGV